jgi:potassium-transporting ATPase potassium-binding subunit
MTENGWLQIALFVLAVLAVTKPLGLYLVAVFEGRVRWLAPVERLLYRAAAVNPEENQHWTGYAGAMLMFSLVSMLLTYGVLRLQHLLPLNPQNFPAVTDRQAFETAASFTTNTNWQSYSGESTMSDFSQMTQLAFHNFVSAAVGMALAVALVRGIAQRSGGRLGNFWTDLVRGILYVLLPISVALAASAWDSRSVAGSSAPTAAGSGRRTGRVAAQSFGSPCRSPAPRRSSRSKSQCAKATKRRSAPSGPLAPPHPPD